MPELDWTVWGLGVLGAVFVGLDKGGLPGMGNLTVALYALALPDPRMSVGVLLPILCSGDFVAAFIYRKHAEWTFVGKLLPWAVLGLVAGYFLFQHLSGSHVRLIIGALLVSFTAIHWGRKLLSAQDELTAPNHVLFRMFTGTLGGFATMIANAAGPVAAFYFVSMRLPKYAFIGTAAWFFLIVNLVKVPFMVDLGIINFEWLPFSAAMMPFTVVATLVAPKIVRHIHQGLFEKLIWFFIVVAGLKLLF